MESLTYSLPEDKIAKHPLANRDQSKLLVYKDGCIQDLHVRDIVDHLPANTLLVRNISRVIPARIIIGNDEIFLVEPKGMSHTEALSAQGSVCWQCMVSNPQKQPVVYEALPGVVAEVRRERGGHHVYFSWSDNRSFGEILNAIGHVPLPPYIDRPDSVNDAERYQTVFASVEGSVAAPTASLHFTPELFQQLQSKGIEIVDVVLHVGLGTFMPITRTLEEHEMHKEFFEVSVGTIKSLQDAYGVGRPIVCLGTTAFRVVESLVWASEYYDPELGMQAVPQWVWRNKSPSVKESLDMLTVRSAPLMGYTQILCSREYAPGLVSGIITNFHQPGSTLIEIVMAFIGQDWKLVYEHALSHNYRFLSYGDASLLWKSPQDSDIMHI